MKNKIKNVFKKFQSYSFIIFLALVLGAFFALAQLNKKPVDNPGTTTDVINPGNGNGSGVVKVEDEKFIIPVASALNPELVRNFYDMNDKEADKLAAIISYQNYYFINQGSNYSVDKETAFDVLSALSGTVKSIKNDMTKGWTVEVEHLYGIKTQYSSLAEVKVAIGDTVKIGDVLGVAGSNEFDKASGVHVHFEILDGNTRLNPENMIGTGISQFKPE